jgi:hypothetical protein
MISCPVVWEDGGGGSDRGQMVYGGGLLAMITKQQYRKLMSEYQATGNGTNSAMKAGMSRRMARKYLQAGQPPQELQAKHTWRTREDPLVAIWPQAEAMLEEAPDLEAKALFEYLGDHSPPGLTREASAHLSAPG